MKRFTRRDFLATGAALAAAWQRDPDGLPSLRLASLKRLRHPMSADLYVDNVVARARELGGARGRQRGAELAVLDLARQADTHSEMSSGPR